MPNTWTSAEMPNLSGALALVTGANSGLGLETSRALAAKGAQVIMACRSMDKAAQAADNIRRAQPEARLNLMQLDLANQASIHQFAAAFTQQHERLDLLINNAGVMIPPQGTTADGFDLQFGTNHLGHFALTGLLLAPLLHAPGARIVTVSSIAHRQGSIAFDDLQWEQRTYRAFPAYGQSKLANLLFTYELQRKLAAAGTSAIAVAAHPGFSKTNLQQHIGWMEWLSGFVMQSAEHGAWPTLFAASAPAVQGGEYYGPSGFMELGGHPKRVGSNSRSHDRAVATRLWQVSEELTGVRYAALAEAPAAV